MIAIFVAQAIPLLMKPESDMYPVINKFLLQRPFLDWNDIPLFYSFLQSSKADVWRKERLWIVRLVMHGFKSDLVGSS